MRIGIVISCSLAAVATVAAARAQPPAAERLAPPAAAAASPDDMGYAMGYRIGQRIAAEQKEIGSPVDQAALAAGLADAVSGKKPRLDEAQFHAAMIGLEAAMRQKQRELAERMQVAAKANLAKGAAYLEKKGAEAGVKALPSGLLYEVLKEGTGPQPTLDDIVVAHYTGRHIDGSEFDGTDPAGEPASFPLRGVVPGWQEALPLMKRGAKWRIHLPAKLGYGEQGSPPTIEPNEVLVFEIELVGSEPAPRR
jgi:FKBP-type peptidyl-prolyl cis-trans isomerase